LELVVCLFKFIIVEIVLFRTGKLGRPLLRPPAGSGAGDMRVFPCTTTTTTAAAVVVAAAAAAAAAAATATLTVTTATILGP
jgi:hypothetical protein